MHSVKSSSKRIILWELKDDTFQKAAISQPRRYDK